MKRIKGKFGLNLIASLTIVMICIGFGIYEYFKVGIVVGLVLLAASPVIAGFMNCFLMLIELTRDIKVVKPQSIIAIVGWLLITFSIFLLPKELNGTTTAYVWFAAIDILSILFVIYAVRFENNNKKLRGETVSR